MEYRICIQEETYDEIYTLMTNINELNKGNEIGGWLLGEWEVKEGIATLHLNEFIIPKQEVSKTEVDLSPESMLDIIQEIGIEKGNKIKAHWHIHPFGKGETSWSGIDDTKIADFTANGKGRDVFMFLLSSEDQIHGRLIMNNTSKNSVLNIEYEDRIDIDELPVYRGTPETGDAAKHMEKLKKRIADKVTEQKNTYGYYGYTKNNTSTTTSLPKSKRMFTIEVQKSTVIARIEAVLYDYISEETSVNEKLHKPDIAQLDKGKYILKWATDNNNTAKNLREELYEELLLCQNVLDDINDNYEATVEEEYWDNQHYRSVGRPAWDNYYT